MKTDDNESGSKAEIDTLTAAFYRAVSFEDGETPPYANLYDIFIESGQIIKNSSSSPEIYTVRQFIEPRQHTIDSGELKSLRESETAEITEIFGNVAHRFSVYEKHGLSAGAMIEGRGAISIQFIATSTGWKISSMAWDDERPGLTLPEQDR